MEFAAITKSGKEVTIEVYYDNQPGVEPGWCWRGKGADSVYAGGDNIDCVDSAEEALTWAKGIWGVE